MNIEALKKETLWRHSHPHDKCPASLVVTNSPKDIPLQYSVLCCIKELRLSQFSGVLMLTSLPVEVKTLI